MPPGDASAECVLIVDDEEPVRKTFREWLEGAGFGCRILTAPDAEAALIHDQRKILDMTATSWLSFREFNGLLVYYTHLMSYRCAIREVRVGIDTAVPDKVLKMPPCDSGDPSVIPHDAQPYLKLAPSTQFVSVELTYRDGSVSEIKSFRR